MNKNPLDIILEDHQRQEEWCDSLERIADSLPGNIDHELINHCLIFIDGPLITHLRDEDEGLIPLLQKRAQPGDNVEMILSQVEREHQTDEGAAFEVREGLKSFIEGENKMGPNALGYLLRSFFEAHRRHIAWENVTLLPLARKRLTDNDLSKLEKIMSDNRDYALGVKSDR